jgi:hypothetical protein
MSRAYEAEAMVTGEGGDRDMWPLAYNAPGPTSPTGFTVPVPKTAPYRPRNAGEREILQAAYDGLTATPPKSVVIRVDGDKITLVLLGE